MKYFKYIVVYLFWISGFAVSQPAGAQNNQVPQHPEDISPLLIGEKIPDLLLTDTSGIKRSLMNIVSKRPAVLVFYRGGWCPYCNVQLAGLQQAWAALDSLGYQVVAVSTDSPSNLKESIMKRKLTYTLLSDADLSLSKKMGIAFKAPETYHTFLLQSSGGRNTDMLLPVPAVFILNTKSEIKFEHIDPDYKIRMSPGLLVTLAKAYLPLLK